MSSTKESLKEIDTCFRHCPVLSSGTPWVTSAVVLTPNGSRPGSSTKTVLWFVPGTPWDTH